MGLFNYSVASRIGLDVGAHSIKAVQRIGRHAITLTLPRDPGSGAASAAITVEEASRLSTVLQRRGFRGREAVIAAPKHVALTSVLDLPPRKNGVPIEQIAHTELALAHRREPEGLTTVSWELPKPARVGEGVTMMAAACPHADADAVIEPLEAAGLRVTAMDLEGLALGRICCSGSSGADSILCIADLGWSSGTLVLYYQGTMVYARQLALGVNSLIHGLQREHGFPPDAIEYLLYELGFEADGRGQGDDWRLLMKGRGLLEGHFEAIAKELALSVRYAQHQYPRATIERVLLSGGGAAVPGLASHLSPQLDVRVETVSPVAAVGAAQADQALHSPAYVVAGGLSLWMPEEATPCAA